MPLSVHRRLALGSAGLLLLAALFLGWRWFTWTPESWLQQRLTAAGIHQWPTPTVNVQPGGTQLSWHSVNLSTDEGAFAAERISATVSWLSIMVGRPQITELTLDAPLWIIGELAGAAPLRLFAHLLDQLAPHRATLTRATLITADTEWLDIEAAGERLGASDRFHWQLTGRMERDDLGGTWTTGAAIQHTEAGARLTEPSWSIDINRGYWRGLWSGKMRAALLDADGTRFEHLSWNNQWHPQQGPFSGGMEWAGAIERLALAPQGVQLKGLDSALAFREPDGATRRLSALSDHLTMFEDRAVGQLSLSYRGQAATGTWRDRTLAVEGAVEMTQETITWDGVELLLGLTSTEQQLSYQINAERLTLATDRGQWRLKDGSWRLRIGANGRPPQSYGFGALAGTWPGLELTEAPAVADELRRHLRLLGPQLEWTHALRSALVSTPGS